MTLLIFSSTSGGGIFCRFDRSLLMTSILLVFSLMDFWLSTMTFARLFSFLLFDDATSSMFLAEVSTDSAPSFIVANIDVTLETES